MKEHEVRTPAGAKRVRRRIGRGSGSGRGTYAGKGVKGQRSRSGVKIRPGFEGGQLPLIKRLPHQRGFHNRFRVEYQVVNVARLEATFEVNAEVTPEVLLSKGLIRTLKRPVKVLGTGDLNKSLKISAHRISTSARAKIEGANGTAEELSAATKPTV